MSIFNDTPSHSQNARPIMRIGSKWGCPISWICFDPLPTFVVTHWTYGRTYPCVEPLGRDCPHCDEEKPRRERAYIGGGHVRRKTYGVLELTSKAGAELADIAKTIELRQRVIIFGREAGRKNASITIEATDQIAAVRPPDDWDTQLALCQIWGINLPGRDLLNHDPRVSGDYAADTYKDAS